MTRLLRTIAVAALPAAVALIGVATVASAQDAGWREIIMKQMEAGGESLAKAGFSPTGPVYFGALNQGESIIVGVQLDAGKSYKIVGACDRECKDLDIVLYDASGTVVDKDVEEDDVPIVEYRPSSTGKYRIEISMATCSANPCHVGRRIFAN